MNGIMKRGYVHLARSIQSYDLWPTKRPFTKLEAWVDLLLTACGVPETYCGVELERGQLLVSERYLANRWKWSKSKVRRFLKDRKRCSDIDLKPDRNRTIISICKYGDYNPGPDRNRTATGPNKRNKKEEEKKNIVTTNVVTAPNAKSDSKLRHVIGFDFEKGRWLNIDDHEIDRWKKAYPAVDVEQELKAMAEWLLSNPSKKKKLYRRFITNWLGRKQERGGSRGYAPKKRLTAREVIERERELRRGK